MTIAISTPPYQQFLDDNGNPLSGGLLYTYAAGTTTPKDTYTDSSGSVLMPNPIVLDSAGRATFFIEGAYKFTLKTSAGVDVRTTDNVSSFVSSGGLSVLGEMPANTFVANLTGSSAVPTPAPFSLSVLGSIPSYSLVGNSTGSAATPSGLTKTAISDVVGTIPGITGFLPSSIAGTSSTAALTFSAGFASDSTNSVFLKKATTTSWAVSNGTNANGYEGGTTLPNSATIHFYVMASSSDNSWTATFASTSLTPTLPSGYLYYKRCFSVLTNGSGALTAYTSYEVEGGAVECRLNAQNLDINFAAVANTTYGLTMPVPGGISCRVYGRAVVGGGLGGFILSSPADPTYDASTNTGFPLRDMGIPTDIFTRFCLITNTASQITVRSGGAGGTVSMVLVCWVDFRR